MERELQAHPYKPYTIIGSREAPHWALQLGTQCVSVLEREGWIGRSGGCRKGMDTCLDLGLDSRDNGEFYVPCVSPHTSASLNLTDVRDLPKYHKAMKMAERVHPAWYKCDEWARKLHGRNPFQVLGQGLDVPSRFVLTWAPRRNRTTQHVIGGTATAVSIAINHDIRIINLFNPVHRKLMEKFVENPGSVHLCTRKLTDRR